MARIPLRNYNREIENLIDRGQIEEAIAHAKNILKQYPKHIETYRLLGKAFLESQRYSEASDILQRVLSVVPDDFVSQLGMSIIREDEGNMDAAIWHMERAYEVQPFNRAVQDELRRLYGRRDGIEPPRVRLTRGSLVRMYARGELFPQAIAETRAALAEDNQRLDLQVLLAHMYYMSGQKVEAAEIASALIGKLPYCLESNRILMEILPETSRAEEARSFQRRVYDLDPYAEFITPNAPTSAQVPDQSVTVERVDWQPSMQENQSPDWAKSIGVKWEENKEEALPDWLNTIGTRPQTDQAPASSQAATPAEELVPDFMRNAGWSQSAQSAEGISPSNTAIEEPNEKDLDQAEMPDWLKSMAPKSIGNEPNQEDDRLGWLNTILPAAGAVGTAAAAALPPEPSPAAETPLPEPTPADSLPQKLQPAVEETTSPTIPESEAAPDWMAEQPSSAGAGEPSTDEIPDWLKDLSSPETQTPATEVPAAQIITEEEISPTEELPSWLQEPPPADINQEEKLTWIQEPEPSTSSVESEELPSWLNAESTDTQPVQEAPDWFSKPVESKPPAETLSGETPSGESPAWLSAMDSSSQAPREASQTDLPAWLSELEASDDKPQDQKLSGSSQTEPGAEPLVNQGVPDWLSEAAIPTDAPPASDEVPSWLSSGPIVPGTDHLVETEPEAEEAPAQPVQADEIPDWLNELKQTDAVQTPPQESLTEVPAAEVPAAGLNLDDMDSAMAWLEGLAAKQGADKDSLKITVPEQRTETPPDWIAGLTEKKQEEEPLTAASEDETPAWLREVSTDEEPVQSIEAVPPSAEAALEPGLEAETPAWLASEAVPAAETSSTPAETNAPSSFLDTLVEPEADTPTQPVAIKPATVEPTQVQAEEQIPLAPISAEPSAPNLDDMDSAMAWLEALAAKQGAEPESLKITTPEQRSEALPDWIAGLAEEQSQSAPSEELARSESEPQAASAPAQPNEEGLPAWLSSGEESATSVPPVSAETHAAKPTEEIPDWLAGSAAETPQPPAEVPTQSAAAAPDLNDMDSALAWLEGLAAKQGAEPNSLKISALEERKETPPDWISELSKTAAAAPPEMPAEPLNEPSIPQEPEIQVHEDLAIAANETVRELDAQTQPAEEPVSEPEIPDWLLHYEEEQKQTTPSVAEAAAPVQASAADETITVWLQQHHPEPGAETTPVEEEAPSVLETTLTSAGLAGSLIAQAKTAVAQGDLDTAVGLYAQAVQDGNEIDTVISDLHGALDRHPVDVSLWQTLGDAYIRADHIQEALDAYTKAEELLR